MTVAQGTPRTDEYGEIPVELANKDAVSAVLQGWAKLCGEMEAENAALSAQVVALTDKFEATHVIVVAAKQAHANAQFRAQALAAQVVELQQHIEQLTGEKFSDRMHAALRDRAETAEAKLKFLTENCDCKEIV